MVRSRCQSADSVVSCWKTSGYSCAQKTLTVTSIVNSFEESKLGRIQGGSWVERSTHILHSHVGVSLNFAIDKALRSSIVSGVGISEESSIEVSSLDSDIESGVRFDVGTSGHGEGDHGRNHIGFRGNITHWNSVARASGDLKTVC